MPYVLRLEKPHRCVTPDERKEVESGIALGSVWACPECGQQHRLEFDQRDGYYWARLRKDQFVVVKNVEL